MQERRTTRTKIGIQTQRGSVTTLSIMLVLGMTLIGTTAVQLVRNHSAFTSGRDEAQEVEMMRSTILQLLDCRRTVTGGPASALSKCDGKSLILRDASGAPIYSSNGNELVIVNTTAAGKTVSMWNVRAACKDNQIFVEKKMAGATSSSIFSSWSGLWPNGREPRLCESFFRIPPSCSGDYDVYAGFDDDGPTCCRMVENSGSGSAAAICSDTEYLMGGGGYCSGSSKDGASGVLKVTEDVSRCMLDSKVLATGQIGTGSATGITMTNPSLPGHHPDTALPAIMAANVSYPRSKSMMKTKSHGGFLLQNGHSYSAASLTVDGWVAACKFDDWEGAFGTTAVGFCCPKRRK